MFKGSVKKPEWLDTIKSFFIICKVINIPKIRWLFLFGPLEFSKQLLSRFYVFSLLGVEVRLLRTIAPNGGMQQNK